MKSTSGARELTWDLENPTTKNKNTDRKRERMIVIRGEGMCVREGLRVCVREGVRVCVREGVRVCVSERVCD